MKQLKTDPSISYADVKKLAIELARRANLINAMTVKLVSENGSPRFNFSERGAALDLPDLTGVNERLAELEAQIGETSDTLDQCTSAKQTLQEEIETLQEFSDTWADIVSGRCFSINLILDAAAQLGACSSCSPTTTDGSLCYDGFDAGANEHSFSRTITASQPCASPSCTLKVTIGIRSRSNPAYVKEGDSTTTVVIDSNFGWFDVYWKNAWVDASEHNMGSIYLPSGAEGELQDINSYSQV